MNLWGRCSWCGLYSCPVRAVTVPRVAIAFTRSRQPLPLIQYFCTDAYEALARLRGFGSGVVDWYRAGEVKGRDT
jgi:hypothetical protein